MSPCFAFLFLVCLPLLVCSLISAASYVCILNKHRTVQHAASQGGSIRRQSPRGRRWPGGFGLYTRHTLPRGDVHHCSTEGGPLSCLLSCSEVCCIASNTSNTSTGILILGMPRGVEEKVHTAVTNGNPEFIIFGFRLSLNVYTEH